MQASEADAVASRGVALDAWRVSRSGRRGANAGLVSYQRTRRPHRHVLGVGVAIMLGAGLWTASSDWSPLVAAPLDAAAKPAAVTTVGDEYRSHMILPLALGGESGRHMGATALVRPLAATPERPMQAVAATLRQGDDLAAALRRAGVGAQEARDAAGLIARALPGDAVASGTGLDIMLGQRAEGAAYRPLESLQLRPRLDLALTVSRHGDGLALRRQAIAVDETPLRVRGTVGSGLYAAARGAGVPTGAVQDYLRALRAHVDIGSLGSADTFDMVIAYRRAATGERQAGRLLYAGLERPGAGTVQLMQWGPKGEFYNPKGLGRETGGFMQPVAARLSSGFGMRVHPILRYRRMHAGVDYAASYGTPIRAVSDGRVVAAGRMGGCGIGVRVNHGGDLQSRSCHMSRMAVRPGQSVTRGQVIGYVGSTGLSTGAHLHFELYRGGRAVNPLGVKFVTRDALSAAELAAFRARLQQLTRVPVGAALTEMAPPVEAEAKPRREIDRIVDKRKVV